MKGRVSVGLDMGGTKIAAGVMDEGGRILHRLTVPTEASQGPDAILARLLSVVDQLVAFATGSGYRLIGVGVASPGVVEVTTGNVIYACANLPGWSGTPLGRAIQERFRVPAWVDNDGNVALVGELRFGAGRGAKDALMITLGTGVGGAVALGGRILRGVNGAAGKFGHIPVSRNGPVCSCGRRGCVEAYVAGPRLVQAAAARFGFAGTAEQLLRLANEGDPRAIRVFREAGERLGIAIAAATNLLDPGLCLVGGGLTAAGDLLLEPARRMMRAKCHPTIAATTRLEVAQLGQDAGLLGAAYLPWNPAVLGV